MSTPIHRVTICVMLVLVISPSPLRGQSDVRADREISPLSGDLYRVRDGNRYTLFLATPEGIVLVDPLSTPTATWLKDELNVRFPGRAVRYVLHTHHHFDRAEGAGLFQGAERIAQDSFNAQLTQARRRLPDSLSPLDGNKDNSLESGEVSTTAWASLVPGKDRDADGRVTADELYRQVPDIRRTYDRTMTISLGGHDIQLIHTASNHAVDMTVLFFPSERIVFAADPPPIDQVPFTFGAWKPSQVFDWIHAVAPLDFDRLVFVDGRIVPRTQLTTLATYLDGLREEAAVARERGLPLSTLLAQTPPQTGHASERTGQLTAIYETLRLRRIFLTGSGGGAYGLRDSAYCAGFAGCNTAGLLAGGSAGLMALNGRIGLGAELRMGAQSWHSRTSDLYEEELAVRETRVAMLARIDRIRPALSVSVVGGPSFTIGDSAGAYREKAALAPLGGRHDVHARSSHFGFTAGVDFARPFGSRFSLVLPVRMTRILGGPRPLWPGNTTLTVGGGLSMRIARQVH